MRERTLKGVLQAGTAIAVVLLIALSLVLVVQFVQKKVYTERLMELEAVKESIIAERETLRQEQEYLTSREYIEKYAREVLGMIKSGENKFTPS